MKKTILNIGTALNKKEQRAISGGFLGNICVALCPNHDENESCEGDNCSATDGEGCKDGPNSKLQACGTTKSSIAGL